MRLFRIGSVVAAAALALPALSTTLSGQSSILLQLRAGAVVGDRFRVDSSGAFVAYGFVRDVGNTTGCAAQVPATGAGTRFMWHPCRGSVRFGRVPTAQTNWDDANMDDFTFAGGNQVVASGYGAFAYGDQVTASSTVGVGFGSGITVSGTAGFSAGASNVCSGFACTALGYTVRAGGQGSVAIGYRATANNDYSVSIGYRGTNNGHDGSIVLAATDGIYTDSVRAQNDGEFRVRAVGGVRLRTSNPANAAPGVSSNTGCDLATGSGTWVCSSSRTIKSDFENVAGSDVLARLRTLPITTWRYNAEPRQTRHLGPVAEDWNQAFGLAGGGHSVGAQDLAGVALAAAQELDRRGTTLQAQLEARTAQVQALQARVDAQARLLTGQARLLAELEARLRALETPAAP